jgi:hypothetical protein
LAIGADLVDLPRRGHADRSIPGTGDSTVPITPRSTKSAISCSPNPAARSTDSECSPSSGPLRSRWGHGVSVADHPAGLALDFLGGLGVGIVYGGGLCGLFLTLPAPGWRPAGWSPVRLPARVTQVPHDVGPRGLARQPAFYALYVVTAQLAPIAKHYGADQTVVAFGIGGIPRKPLPTRQSSVRRLRPSGIVATRSTAVSGVRTSARWLR